MEIYSWAVALIVAVGIVGVASVPALIVALVMPQGTADEGQGFRPGADLPARVRQYVN